MAFTLLGNTITQTGIDTSLAGLNGLAGVTYSFANNMRVADLNSTLSLVINGTLTIEPSTDLLIYRKDGDNTFLIGATGILNLGLQISQGQGITQYSEGTAILALGRSTTEWGCNVKVLGTLNVYGATIISAGGLGAYENGMIRMRDANFKSLPTQRSPNTYANMIFFEDNSTCDIVGLSKPDIKDYPGSSVSINGFGVNVISLSGFVSNNAVQADDRNYSSLPNRAPMATFSDLEYPSDYSALTSSARILNCQWHLSKISLWHRGGLYVGGNSRGGELQAMRDLNIKFTNNIGVGLTNVVMYFKDINNGNRANSASTLWGTLNYTQDYTVSRVQLATSNVSGLATMTIMEAAWYNRDVNMVFFWAIDSVSTNILDNRINTDYSIPLFGLAYGYNIQDFPAQGSRKGAYAATVALVADAAVTLTEANAITKLASSFSVNMTTNTITVLSSSTLDDLYDVMKVFKTRNVQSQIEYPTVGAQPVVASGDTLVTSMSIVGLEFLTAGTKFKKIQANCVANGSISNIYIIGNVTQNTPTNIVGVTIAGTLTYNTNSIATVSFTDTVINVIKNDGTAVITINKVNSSISNYIDAEINFFDSTVAVIGADTVTFHPTATDRDLNVNVSGSFLGSTSFKFGSTVNGSLMSGTLYLRCVAGGIPFNVNKSIVLGDNLVDLGTTAQLASLSSKIDLTAKQSSLAIVYEGVKKVSQFKPVKTDL